ncbi:MAG: tetratricopeptide repeat protein, partial [Microcystaceae cyanobacterium]
MADIYRKQREWIKAEMYYKEVLNLDPVNAEAHLGLGQTYIKSQRNEDALSEIMASLGLIYHNPTAHYLCGVALYRCGRGGEAITALERAISQNPVFPVAHRYLATIYAKDYHNPQKSAQHRNLAREAQQRIKDFKAGKLDLNQNAESVSDWVISINTADKPKLESNIEDTVIIVSGLPRSGTSMMMQMLAAGGIPVMTDGVREADESNPKGYYEYEKAKQVGSDNSWIPDAKGKVVKIVAQLLPKL